MLEIVLVVLALMFLLGGGVGLYVAPCDTVDCIPHRAATYPVGGGNACDCGGSFCVHQPSIDDHLVVQFGICMPFATVGRSMSDLVRSVFGVSAPTEVVNVIVSGVPVEVSAFHLGRARTNERNQYEGVGSENVANPFFPNGEVGVSRIFIYPRSQLLPLSSDPTPTASFSARPHGPVVADSVTGKSDDVFECDCGLIGDYDGPRARGERCD